MALTPSVKIDTSFAHFELFENYLIATVKEGIVLDALEMRKFHEIFNNHYSDRPFGYISNRKFDYTINPTYYKEIEKYQLNLVGVATLCYSEASYKMALFAQQFFMWPHKVFYTLEECIHWLEGRIEENKKADL